MKKQYQLLCLFSIIAILCLAPEITSMTASAQSVITRHCTAGNPCVSICGDHVCAPGEFAQMTAKSTQAQMNNTSTNATSPVLGQPMGMVVGGIISYLDEASDGTAVIVRTGHPVAGQVLDIGIGFKDATNSFVSHQNYAITVTQDNKTVLSNPMGHTHTGTDSLTTDKLPSGNPVDIKVTLNGVGLPTADPSTWTGVKGEVLTFSHVLDVKVPTSMSNMTNATSKDNAVVPEFGPVVSIVLAIAILSVLVLASKTRVIPRL